MDSVILARPLEDSTYLVWINISLALSPEDFVATGTIMRINRHGGLQYHCGTATGVRLKTNKRNKKKKKQQM